MANSAQVFSAISAFVQEKGPTIVRDNVLDQMPTLDWFLALSGDMTEGEGVGRPESSMVIGKMPGAKVHREKMMAERVYYPIIHDYDPDAIIASDLKPMDDYDNNPTVTDWENRGPLSGMIEPRVKFFRHKLPWKVPHSDERTAVPSNKGRAAQSATAIKSPYEVEIKKKSGVMAKSISQMLFGRNPKFPTGAPSNEDSRQWDCCHSFANALGTTNTYCGLDRTVGANAFWQGITTTAATPAVLKNLINNSLYDQGWQDKGYIPDLLVVGATPFQKMEAEADGKTVKMVTGEVQALPRFGFKGKVIEAWFGATPTYVIYDPMCQDVVKGDATNYGYLFNSGTWTTAFRSGGNFTLEGPIDLSKTSEDGDEADAGRIVVEALMICEAPKYNRVFTNLT